MDENRGLATKWWETPRKRKNKPTRPGTYTPSPLPRVQTATRGALDLGRGMKYSPKGAQAWEYFPKALPRKRSVQASTDHAASHHGDQLRVPSRFIRLRPSAREAHRAANGTFSAGPLANKKLMLKNPQSLATFSIIPSTQQQSSKTNTNNYQPTQQPTQQPANQPINFDIFFSNDNSQLSTPYLYITNKISIQYI